MLIGIDASRANIEHKSGPAWYSYYLIRWLAKLDDKNEYILYTDKPLHGGLLDLKSDQYYGEEIKDLDYPVDKNGFQRIDSPHNNFRGKVLDWPYKYFWTQGRLSKEMLFHRPDVLFVPAHTLPFIRPKKSLVTIHDVGYERMSLTFGEGEIGSERSLRKSFINLLLRFISLGRYKIHAQDYLRWSTHFAVKKAYRIIANSNFTKKDIMNLYGANENKIEVIYNGYNRYLFSNIDDSRVDSVLQKYGIEKPYLFYIGRIERKKNIPLLIEAFAIFKEQNKESNHKLLLVGDASHGYDETKYMISEFDLQDDVMMPGWIDEIDVPYIFRGADAFIFPSNYEGFGLPLLQAMAAEVPIAASNITSIPEVSDGAVLLFNPDHALMIADAIKKILFDDELRKELVEKGKKRKEDFSWQKTAEKTLELINKLA